jgi:hypothetical protein
MNTITDIELKAKGELINKIMYAVNANAAGKENGRRADGDMFFALAFKTEKELKEICNKAGIPIK